MNEMSDMRTTNRDYDNRGYDNRYDNRYYDEAFYGNRENYREDYRRDYDRRGGRMNNRDYRNYREHDYYEELEMTMEDMREQYRKLEDISEMAHNMQDKNMIMKVAQKEKENYTSLKQLVDKQM